VAWSLEVVGAQFEVDQNPLESRELLLLLCDEIVFFVFPTEQFKEVFDEYEWLLEQEKQIEDFKRSSNVVHEPIVQLKFESLMCIFALYKPRIPQWKWNPIRDHHLSHWVVNCVLKGQTR